MYIIDIIPLAFIPRNQGQVLSYYFDKPVGKYALVEAVLNHRKIAGIAVGCDSLKMRKLDFKKSVDFELKNLSRVIDPEPQISEIQFKIASWLSNYYYTPLGICLKHVLPPFFNKRGYSFTPFYQNTDRNNSRNGKQVFLLIPEILSGKYFLNKYAAKNPVFVSSNLSNKEYFHVWKKIYSGESYFIIGTRVGLFLSFKNLGSIIVEDESNEAYKSDMSPRYNAADLAFKVAEFYKSGIELNSVFPRLETSFRLNLPANIYKSKNEKYSIVDMVREIKSANFSIFSRDLKDEIKKVADEGGKLIIFAPRRGYSNFLLCGNCGRTLTCPNCNASLVVHIITEKDSSLLCHHCVYRSPVPPKCPACESYGLKSYGIGIQKVDEHLLKYLKLNQLEAPNIYRLDSDLITSDDEETKIVDNFLSDNKSVLLTTQMIFSHKHRFLDAKLTEKPVTGIITADSLINIPDFRTDEYLLRQILTLKAMSQKLLIQSHNPEMPVLKYLAEDDIYGLTKRLLSDRRELFYPPFSSLVKLAFRGSDNIKAKREILVIFEKIRQLLKNSSSNFDLIGPFPAFTFKEKGLYKWIIILRHRNQKSDFAGIAESIKKRNEILRLVPSSKGWTIDIDPSNII